jgi:serine/threonine protein kinase
LPPESPPDLYRDTSRQADENGPGTVSYPTGAKGSNNDSCLGSASPEGVATDGPQSLPDIPGYAVEAEIARGGMGVVYRALNLRLNRTTAIKMIISGKYHDPVARVRFLIEAEAVAQLDHPNVVHVHEFGTHDGLVPLIAASASTLRAHSSRPERLRDRCGFGT